jgi:transketolase C-terminal domain/subunit
MATLPNIQIIEPSCKKELELTLNHAIASNLSTYVRIASVGDMTSEFTKEDFRPGGLVLRKKGGTFAIVSSGPWLTEEAIKASDIIGRDMCAVYTYPFLNSPPLKETVDILKGFEKILVLENFTPAMATGMNLMSQPSLKSKMVRVGLNGIPKNGWNSEVMKFHGLDSLSLAALLN